MKNKQPSLPDPLTLPKAAMELEKGKTYLFVFDDTSGVNMNGAAAITAMLNDHGFHGMAIMLKDSNGVKISVQKLEEKKEP